MNCPTCRGKEHVEIDLHADGYAKNLFECATCGTIWLGSTGEVLSEVQEVA